MSKSDKRRTKAARAQADAPDTEMTTRILDAARACFERQGVAATTMADLASDAGISRAWLYRKFPNREEVVRALVARETQRLIAGVIKAANRELELAGRMTNAFVYVVSFLRQSALLKRLLISDRAALASYLLEGVAPVLQGGVETISAALSANGSLRPAQARKVGDAIVRLVFSIGP